MNPSRPARRWLRGALAGVALLAAAPLAAWSQAPPTPQAPPAPALTPAQERAALATGNVVHVLYHVLGHALIEELQLHPAGAAPPTAEDNAHQLSTLMMIAASDDPASDAMLLAAMRGLRRAERWSGRTHQPLPFWAGHALDPARLQSILCPFYGSEPDEYRRLAEEIGLTEEQRRGCIQAFATLISTWGPLVKPHMSDTGDSGPAHGTISVAWADAGTRWAEATQPLRASRAIETIAGDLSVGLRLPRDIVIRLQPCERPDATWNADRHDIVLCYELIEAFDRLIAEELR